MSGLTETSHSPQEEPLLHLQEAIGYTFKDVSLLQLALTHASYANEEGDNEQPLRLDNQRMEFLGDSVLGLAISTHLYKAFPNLPEGKLSRLRSSLVCEGTLARQAETLQLGLCLRLGRGERSSGGHLKASLLSDAYEAILAAVYLDSDYVTTEAVILRAFKDELTQVSQGHTVKDFKTRLQELIQSEGDERPRYMIVETTGPPHARSFTAEVRVGLKLLGSGQGRNKKSAQQDAARAALELLAERAVDKGED